jgi:hypothetical protein
MFMHDEQLGIWKEAVMVNSNMVYNIISRFDRLRKRTKNREVAGDWIWRASSPENKPIETTLQRELKYLQTASVI